MKRKVQFYLNDETWTILESITNEANEGFVNGSINTSDVINEIIPNAKIDIKALQIKHINIRKSLKLIAMQKDVDIDSAIRSLMELKAKGSKKNQKNQLSMEVME